MIRLAPSLLAADFSRLGEEVARVDRAGAQYIHLDVMDGPSSPVFRLGCRSLRGCAPARSGRSTSI